MTIINDQILKKFYLIHTLYDNSLNYYIDTINIKNFAIVNKRK